MDKPFHTTDRPRKYLAGRICIAGQPLFFLGGGSLPAGTRMIITGHLGSMIRKFQRGVRHPQDLLIGVRKRRRCRQPNVYDEYWIPVKHFNTPGHVVFIRRKRKKEEIRRSVGKAVDDVERSVFRR